MTRFEENPVTPDPPHLDICGDADSSGSVVAVDALRILGNVVSGGTCVRCDVDGSGEVTSTDALAVLQAAIGLPTPLLCDAPASGCF